VDVLDSCQHQGLGLHALGATSCSRLCVGTVNRVPAVLDDKQCLHPDGPGGVDFMFDKGIEVSNDNEEMLLDKMLASKAKKQTCLQNSTRETIIIYCV